jgi:hydrogenase-4 component F
MERLKGTLRASPVWGLGLLTSMLVLCGAAPFAVFMSELQIVKAAFDVNAIAVLVLFLLGTGVVFLGVIRHATAMAWGSAPDGLKQIQHSPLDVVLVALPLLVVLLLGLWMPPWLFTVLQQAAAVVSPAR